MDRKRTLLHRAGRGRWGSVGSGAGALYWGTLAAALLLPPVIGHGLPAAAGLVWQGLAAAAGLTGCGAVYQAARRKQRIPSGGRRRQFPRVTMGVIAAGALLFLLLPEAAVDRLSGLNLDEAGLADLIRLTAVRSLLHDSFGHLLANALLLGLLGYRLEPALGAGRTLAVLVLGSCVASLTGLNLLLSQVEVHNGAGRLLHYPPAGGTGALAAFLGLAAAGLRYGRPKAADSGADFPFSGLDGALAPLLTGLLFMGVFSGHTVPLTGNDAMAGYWGQVGGYLGGLATAGAMRTLESAANRQSGSTADASATPEAESCAVTTAVGSCTELREKASASHRRLATAYTR